MSDESKKVQAEGEETEERPRRGYTREGLEEASAGFLKALGDGLGQLLDQGSKELETIARSGKAQYDLVQAKRDRDLLYRKLGRELYAQWQEGAVELPGQEETLAAIQELNERLETKA